MNALVESPMQVEDQAPNAELFVPDTLEHHERLRAAEEFIYGECTGYLGEPRMVSLSPSNANYNQFKKLTWNSVFANRTLTSGYAVRVKEGPGSDPHDNFRICVCVSGGVAVRTARGKEELGAGDIYVNYSRNYELSYSEGEYSRIVVPKKLMTGLEEDLDMLLVLKSSDPVTNLVRTAVTSCAQTYQSRHNEGAHLASDLLVTISRRLLEGSTSKNQATGYSHIRDRAIAYIQDNLHRADLSVIEVAQYIHVSRATLYRAFEILGGLKDYIMVERVARAKTMLRLGRTDRGYVSNVAYATGFTSPERFSKVFKDKTGMSPTHFVEAGLT